MFNTPMDWASDEQLRIARRELDQAVVRLKVYNTATALRAEVVGLKQVELELKLRGIE